MPCLRKAKYVHPIIRLLQKHAIQPNKLNAMS